MAGRILLVDDEEPILFAMREYFGFAGFEVDCASDLASADGLIGSLTYDVVIADLHLTRMGSEGLEVVAHAHAAGARTILLTAYGYPDMEREARRRGADRILHKPQPLPELVGEIRTLLGEERE